MFKNNIPEFELVDTHCHVDLYPDASPILNEAVANKVLVLAVTNAPSVFFHTKKLSEVCDYLLPAVGLHPELIESHGHEAGQMIATICETKFVGEVGLDYVTSNQTVRARQRQVFTKILERCSELGERVVTVHSRRAASDVLAAIGQGFNGSVILHWFTGTKREAEQALNQGCYFSVNTAMLVSKSSMQILEMLPRDRVLTETDGPFITYQRSAAVPSQVSVVTTKLASLWSISENEVRKIVVENFIRACS